MGSTGRNTSWEYKQFIFRDWKPEQKWTCLATQNRFQDCDSELMARQFLWHEIRESIMQQLQPWLNEGWELVESVGPEAIELNKDEKIDPQIGAADVFMWVITLGLGLIFQLVSGQTKKRYLCFTPKAFSVTLRHVPHHIGNELVSRDMKAA